MKIRDIQAWDLYTQIKNQHEQTGLFTMTDRCHNFYVGDQWRGCETGGEKLPVLNLIKPIVDHKVATVAQNKLSIAINPLNVGEDFPSAQMICSKLTEHMSQMWEQHKMDRRLWDACRNAAITGDSYMLFYDGKGNGQILDRTQIYLADEQNRSLQEQKFIIIKERRFVEDVKRVAKANGVDASFVTADSDTTDELGNTKEVKGDFGKVSCILMLWRDEDGFIHRCRACKLCVFEPDSNTGLTLYPIASFLWNEKKGSARGIGEVEPIIANQIEINKQNARMIMASKLASYPKIAYRKGTVTNPAQLESVGGAIEVDDVSVSALSDMVTYLYPASMSSDVLNIWSNLYQRTKDLAGASDAALGMIDPSKASGTAIIAVKSQAALPLSSQMAGFKQFVEGVAHIWWDQFLAYNPQGMKITVTYNGLPREEIVTAETLKALRIRTRVDATPDSPFDKYAQEQSVERALTSGMITFEEYVSTLDGSSIAPKAKFEAVLAKRAEAATTQMMLPTANDVLHNDVAYGK